MCTPDTDRARLDKLVAAWPAAQRKSYSGTAAGAAAVARSESSDLSGGRQRGGAGSGGPRAGPLKQLRLLLLRSWRQVGWGGAGQSTIDEGEGQGTYLG